MCIYHLTYFNSIRLLFCFLVSKYRDILNLSEIDTWHQWLIPINHSIGAQQINKAYPCYWELNSMFGREGYTKQRTANILSFKVLYWRGKKYGNSIKKTSKRLIKSIASPFFILGSSKTYFYLAGLVESSPEGLSSSQASIQVTMASESLMKYGSIWPSFSLTSFDSSM